jgi:hypothetical protein
MKGAWLAWLLVCVSCSVRISQTDPEAAAATAGRDAVREALVRYYETLSARDWIALPSHFWPGAVLGTIWQQPGSTAPDVMLVPIEEYVRLAPAGPGSRQVFEERPLSFDVRVHGALAAAWVRYEARFGDPGDMTCWRGIDAFNLLRHDGAWRIVSVAYKSDDDFGPAGRGGC